MSNRDLNRPPVDFLEDVYGTNENRQPMDFLSDVYGNGQNESPLQQESLKIALALAPGRITEDVGQLVRRGLQAIPEYWEKAQTEIPGIFQTAHEHPLSLAKQGIAGLAELGKGTFNAPHNIVKYLSERLNLVPQDINEKVQMARMPEDTQSMINAMFGNPEHPGEAMFRGTFRNAPALGILGKTGSVARGLTDKGIIKDVLNTKYGNIEKYSGPQGKYNEFFQKAATQGARPDINVDLNNINFKSLGEKQIKNNYEGIEKLRSGQLLQLDDYQSAIKELGIIERGLKDKKVKEGVLTDKLDARYHEAKKAKKYIQENMLKDAKGNKIKKLLPEYKQIQKGYALDVLPYTTNKQISKFEAGKIKESELINSLRKSPFAVERGKYHGIQTRDKLKKALAISGGVVGLGALYEHGSPLATALIRALNEQR